MAHEFGNLDDRFAEEKHLGARIFELAYDSRYRPQWLWFRGRSKRRWIEKVGDNTEKVDLRLGLQYPNASRTKTLLRNMLIFSETKVWKTYEFRPPAGPKGPMVLDEDMVALRNATSLTTKSWGVVIGMTLLLMGKQCPESI